MTKIKDLSGERFGRLTVSAMAAERVGKERRVGWVCECECGKTIIAIGKNLKNGKTQSCGCLRADLMREARTTHGGCNEKLYNVWRTMKARCHNPKDADFCYYGARGVTVCDRWRNSYSAFRDDVGCGWKEGLTLDRIDNDGDYEPGNTRWVTMNAQAKNRRPRYSVFATRRNRKD